MSNPNTLLELIQVAPGDRTAVILPEAGLRVTYQSLRDQVAAMADAMASLGVGRGDRVATVLPNGLPAIVSFLAASVAGTAAPLNPGYREDEFSFFLEDTAAKILLVPGDGAPDARKAAEGRGIPVFSLEMDERGFVRIAGVTNGKKASAPSPDDIALVLHTSGSTGRPKRVPILHRNITASTRNIVDHYSLTSDDVAMCVMPLFHVHGLVASTLSTLLSGGTVVAPQQVQPAFVLADRSRQRRHVVFGGSHDSQPSALPRRQRAARGLRGASFHPLLQCGITARDDGEDGAGVWRTGAGSVRDDRGLTSNVFESSAAGRQKAGLGRTGNRSQDQHHG
jgi:acyl-CoA synthetase (AMP-forming)/AMP-acid ligase II